jgi:hypothetical protein
VSTKEKAIKDLLYISENSGIKNFMKKTEVLKKAKEFNLSDLPDYVGINSTKYLDLLAEDWQQYK